MVELHRKKHTVDHSNSTAHIKPPLLCTYQGAVHIRTDINYRVTCSCSILALLVSAYSSLQPPLPTDSHTMLCRETLRSSSHQDTALKSHFLAKEQHLKVTHLNAVSEKKKYIYVYQSISTTTHQVFIAPCKTEVLSQGIMSGLMPQQFSQASVQQKPSYHILLLKKKYNLKLVTRLLRFFT